ncbi:V-set and transmembrane domain-containing protein 2-like protein [Cyprinus carpio]|uniref:V-set and transmembrane domain-containing protein 2-like protein n=1 Tax=Cyprinus carpio TaxID=7962 RepID=A0A9Q9Y7K4_CYPCA|nr:V-set and transmembrane domain-containing protein 2-like protein [Cyprinus carpio]
MGSFGEMLWIIHSVGLYAQISANLAVDNHVSGNALFTEVPQDVVSQAGDDVEMACSFRGASSSSVSLEIQWWYTRHSREGAEQPAWTTNQESLFLFTELISLQGLALWESLIVKCSCSVIISCVCFKVVKVVGSNISHKLRLSSVRPSDEGTYECQVIDFSEGRAQRHRVQADTARRPESRPQQRPED